jgi:Aspartyl/Asparaginyl beta-hydroxylase
MNHFRQVLSGIDVKPLLRQLADHPDLWSKNTEWTRKKAGSAIYNEDNIVLRYLTFGMERDGRLFLLEAERDRNHWTRPAFHLLTAAQPIVFDLMRAVPGEHLGHVIITRLPPGGEVGEHIDRWPEAAGAPYWRRYQVPLSAAPGVTFHCGDERLYMEPGNAYWFDNQIFHRVTNQSSEERISMLADIRPFHG